MMEVVCVLVIVFKKPDLKNAPRRVYSQEIRQLFLTKNTEPTSSKTEEQKLKILKFGCLFDKLKTFTNVKSFVFTA